MSRLSESSPFAGLPTGVTVTHAVARHVGPLSHDVLYFVVTVGGESQTLRVKLDDGRSVGERITELGATLRAAFAAQPVSPPPIPSAPRMDPRIAALGKRPRPYRPQAL